jgi:hypothetical protein
MCEKVSLRLFPVPFQRSDKDAAEIGCRCGGLEHGSDTAETRCAEDCEAFNLTAR